MNIFFVDECPVAAARVLVDQHVSKLACESSQLLGAALQYHGYKLQFDKEVHSLPSRHLKHPSTLSVIDCLYLAEWLVIHALELCCMYTEATSKVHASESKIKRCGELIYDYIPSNSFELTFRTACGYFNLSSKNPIEVYRKFYVNDKVCFANWGKYNNSRPDWFDEDLFDKQVAWELQRKRNKRLKNPVSKADFNQKVYEVFSLPSI